MRRLILLAARIYRKIAYAAVARLVFPASADPLEIEARILRRFRPRRRLFDAADYLERHEDVQASSVDPYDHFLRHGAAEGREARFFDEDYYLWKNPDVVRAGLDAFVHYKSWGGKEYRPVRFTEVRFLAGQSVDYGEWYVLSTRRRRAECVELPEPPADGSPLISVVMPTYNSDIFFLDRAICSVLSQSYRAIELCIADDASPNGQVRERIRYWATVDPRVKFAFRQTNGHISAATNTAIGLASGRYIAFMDHDDELAEDALACVARRLATHPECVLLYSDEDKLDEQGQFSQPHFKPDFNFELLLAQNYINHLSVVRAEDVRRVGGVREGFEGAQDHDFLLRLCRTIPRSAIQHVPEVLYHWRMTSISTASDLGTKPYVEAAAMRALSEHCAETGVRAKVSSVRRFGHYRVQYEVVGRPKVSIIIPTRDRLDFLKQCIKSLVAKTAYDNYEIVVADNDSSESRTLRYFEELKARGIRVLACPGPFNPSSINNRAAVRTDGEFLLLLNNAIEIIDDGWLTEMLSQAQQPGVGCVGARLWYPDRTLQHGGVILGMHGVAAHAHRGLPMGAPGYFGRAACPQRFSAVTAACLLVRRSIYEEVGGLDELLAVAFNDVDFCLKVDAAGYRNVWTPYAELVLHESQLRGEENIARKRELFRSEVELVKARWGERLENDPYYNPNLALDRQDFAVRPL